MKKIEAIMEQMTGRHILESMAELFRQHDDEFSKDEALRNAAVEKLRATLPEGFTPSLDEYIAAHERNVLTMIVYAGYNGFQINLANFHAPYGVNFTSMEFFDIAKEHIIGNLPTNIDTYRVTEAFYNVLPEDLRECHTHISEYYTNFECAGPKLAHYAGYVIANNLLPWIQPGYQMDPVQTIHYESDIKKYCGYTPL